MKHKSVLGLFATHSLPKILALCLVMAVIQLYFLLRDPFYYENLLINPQIPLFSYVVVTFLSIFFCSLHGVLKDGTYTILRLGKPMRDIFHALVCNQFCSLFIIWGTQAFILMFGRGVLGFFSPESSFLHLFYLDSWHSAFFHFVLPTLDIFSWTALILRNLLLSFLGATITMKVFYGEKRNKYYVFLLLMMASYLDISGVIFEHFIYGFASHFDLLDVYYSQIGSLTADSSLITNIFCCVFFGISNLFLFLGGKNYD